MEHLIKHIHTEVIKHKWKYCWRFPFTALRPFFFLALATWKLIFFFSSPGSTGAGSWFVLVLSKWPQRATKSSWHCIDPWKIKVTHKYPPVCPAFWPLKSLLELVLSSLYAPMSRSRSSRTGFAIIFIGLASEVLITVLVRSRGGWRKGKLPVNTSK